MLLRILASSVLALAALAPSAQAIIGGRPASRPYPFMVSLQSGGGHFCGGSLVRQDWVLTAAHCVEGTTEDEQQRLRAVLGRVNLQDSGGEELEIDLIKVHETYAADDEGGHDIALLHLATPSAQSPVRLAAAGDRAVWEAGAPARVIGWGAAVFLVGPGSDDLQEADVPVVSDEDCQRNYDASPFVFNRETMVCAGELTGLRDSCQGDSGGPLLAGDLAGEPVQVGTVSFGLGCGFPAFYGVYGRVGDKKLGDWLAANLPPAGAAPAAAPAAAPVAPVPAPAAPASAARLRFTTDLGSARLARRRRSVRVRVTTTSPVTALTAVLQRGSRILARVRLPKLDDSTTLKLPLAPRAARTGRLRLRLTATDSAGRRVSRSGAVRLRR